MKTNTFVITLLALFLFSCTNEAGKSDKIIKEEAQKETSSIQLISDEVGIKLLQTNCYSCHNPNSESHDNMLAPPLAGIKHKYKTLFQEEELFVAQMAAFVHNPTKDKALMKGPVRRFGLMPKTALSKSEIEKIVTFIYHTELPVPSWFSEHYEEEHQVKWEDRFEN
jgi:hypothetical protein